MNTDLRSLPDFAEAVKAAHRLHDGVPYGNGQAMFDQVLATANLVYHHTQDPSLTKLALLHKALDKKSIAAGKDLSQEELSAILDAQAMAQLSALSHEPCPFNGWHGEYLARMQQWAAGLDVGAQTVLLAEKAVNMRTSADPASRNPHWPPEVHLRYLNTRMIAVEACKHAHPCLYQEALTAYREAARQLQAEVSNPSPGLQPKSVMGWLIEAAKYVLGWNSLR